METMNNLESYIFSKTLITDFVWNKSDILYHYTSPVGLQGIIGKEKIKLWFSNTDYLNDTSEGYHIVNIYKLACEELLQNQLIDNEFYKQIISILPNKKEFFTYDETNYTQCKMRMYQTFICCFSASIDLLPMWNYYVKNGKYEGYCVGFSFFDTQHQGVQNYFGKGYALNTFKVIYHDSEKKDILKKEILDIYSFYNEDNAGERIKSYLSNCLNKLQFVFKNNCFQHENEIRMILTLPTDWDSRKNSSISSIKYRSFNGYSIPYVEVEFLNKTLKSVMSGPLLNNQSAEKSIFNLLDHYGYNNVEILSSTLPIRY